MSLVGVVLHLRGRGLPALRSSLWGEQVISYAGSGDRANRGGNPGVSHGASSGLSPINRLFAGAPHREACGEGVNAPVPLPARTDVSTLAHDAVAAAAYPPTGRL